MKPLKYKDGSWVKTHDILTKLKKVNEYSRSKEDQHS